MSLSSPSWLAGRLVLAAGIPRDYLTLHAFHYLPKKPRTFAQVWVVRYVEQERPERAENGEQARRLHGEGTGASSRVVAVAVLSWPYVRCAMRERHFKLKGLALRQKLAFANAHVRTISRVVVHPQFRSLGLASALVECICANCPTRYVEASARMADFHPMFERGGMTRILSDDPALPAYFLYEKEARTCDTGVSPVNGRSEPGALAS